MVRVALDAMGGDRAPTETVAGALQARSDGVDVILVGDEPVLREMLARHDEELPIVHAPELVEMGEDPLRALRSKRESSIAVCARLVKEGTAGALVSAGSTGAALAAAAHLLGRSPGVHRPAIAVELPTGTHSKILVDAGANPDCRPEHLLQFALMGCVFARVRFGIVAPRVGLLNIGQEPGKGRQLEREAYELLVGAPIDFVGNIEGRDLFSDLVDVIVTDGFSGNLVLKTSEGAMGLAVRLFTEAVQGEGDARLDPSTAGRLSGLYRRLDYESYGGASLIGVDGVVTIAHGSSSRVAVANALGHAASAARSGLVEQIAAAVAAG